MSKYQEALIRIRDLTDVQVDVDDLYNFVTGSSFEADIEKLQELVDKETPMKATSNGTVYFCNKCHGTLWQIQIESEYCFRCGQKIDWSED